jgi:hypothetical protein
LINKHQPSGVIWVAETFCKLANQQLSISLVFKILLVIFRVLHNHARAAMLVDRNSEIFLHKNIIHHSCPAVIMQNLYIFLNLLGKIPLMTTRK